MLKKLPVMCLFLIAHWAVKATHIIGGEMSYDCLGNNNYRITLKIYRDCINGAVGFDDPAAIGIYNGPILVQSLDITPEDSLLIPPAVANPCLAIPPNVCVKECRYVFDVNLPPINGGYTIVYQRCCRNNTILNISNPQDVGATYQAYIPGSGLFACNNSPRYNLFPPVALCAGDPLVFDHSATDPDGDSLVYSLCTPYSGADPTDPAPNPPAGPPFIDVIYVAPFMSTYPLGSNPALAINQQTGLLTGTPNQIGQFVVAVCVSEYRNGQLIAVHKRDFQFNVVNCLSDVGAAFINPSPDPLNSCNGFAIQFTNQSTNSSYYLWDFGDSTTTTDTSTAINPVYTYPQPGQYTVMLIANPGFLCADTTYITFGVYPVLVADFDPPPGQCVSGNSFNFTAGGTFQNDTQITWDFGPQATPQTSTAQTPQGISYPAPGTYDVTLTYVGQGCTRTHTEQIEVYALPTVGLNIDNGNGCVPFGVVFNNTSTASSSPLQYLWNFGDGEFSTETNPYHLYTSPGAYDVTLTAYSLSGCVDTMVLNMPNLILVKPSPTANIVADPIVTDVLNPAVTVTDLSTGGVDCQLWWGIGDTLNNCQNTYSYNYTDSGTYYITQIVINQFGCPDTAIIKVRINPIVTLYAPNAFTPNGDMNNDGFRLYGEGIASYELLIYNRWGQKVFESNNIFEEWNGTLLNKGGEIAADGVFVYAAYYTTVFGEKGVQRGKVVLVKGDRAIQTIGN